MTSLTKISDLAKKLMDDYAEKAARHQMTHKEFFALAFLGEVGCQPSEAELVEQHTGTEIRWFFRKRGEV